MADDDIGPDYLTARGVPSSRRGYDKRVIDALHSEARDRWQILLDRYEELRATVEASGGLEFLGRELGAVGLEVGEILSSAQQAAEGMRTRSQEEANRIEVESTAAAIGAVAEAERQAFDLRRDAWETGMDVLDAALVEAERVVSAGKDDALLIRAQAEKDSYRHISGSEREASGLIRQARYEADRRLNQAREVAQQIIDRTIGPEHLEASGESIPPDLADARREELLEEIERLRLQRSIESVKVFGNEPQAKPAHVEPADEGFEPDGIDLSDVLAAEVQEMRSDPETIPIRVDPPAQVFGTEDDVGTLFEALRTTGEVETIAVGEQLPTDPFELKDKLLLPIINAGVRETKRLIVEMQNVALDGLRSSGWEPHPPDIGRELGLVLESVIHKAGSAGATAAGPLAGLFGSLSEPGNRGGRLVISMSAALAGQLAASLEDVGGPELAAEAIGRVFRSWRNDTAERWVRSIATAAYHDSLLAALRSGGIDKVTALSNVALCEKCAGPDGLSWRPGREPPDGMAVPPASLACTCTITPAE